MVLLRSCRYERLHGDDFQEVVRPRRRIWVKRLNGQLKGLRLARSRKLTLKVLSVLVLPSKIARIYAEIARRIKNMDGSYPSIVFATQWGLPVLSHSSDRNLARFC